MIKSRAAIFLLILVALLLVGGGYTVWAMSEDAPAPIPTNQSGTSQPQSGDVLYVSGPIAGAPGPLAWQKPGATTVGGTSALNCNRAYFAGSTGVCVKMNPSQSAYQAEIFGPDLVTHFTVPLVGTPSRARVSPDGRFGATTMFVTGDSYADANFSTRTNILDLTTGTAVLELEKMTTTRNGKVIDAPDVNYWGVTFEADSNRFFATLGTGGEQYLIEGDVRSRTAQVIRENVQCPSLSPDGTRIAYKKNDPDDTTHLFVLDLRTMQDTRLAEPDAVDDQAEWVNNSTVSYGTVDAQVMAVPADGTGSPRVLLTNAQSPATLR